MSDPVEGSPPNVPQANQRWNRRASGEAGSRSVRKEEKSIGSSCDPSAYLCNLAEGELGLSCGWWTRPQPGTQGRRGRSPSGSTTNIDGSDAVAIESSGGGG